MTNKVIVFGNGGLSVVNHFYLTNDSPYQVVAFTVDEEYLKEEAQSGLPIVPFEKVETFYPPTTYLMSILVSFREVNQLRAQKYSQAKSKGYQLINYVSSKAVIWPGSKIGDNCYIYENTIIQPFAMIGNDVVIGPGSIIGHHSHVKDHCFLATRTTILGSVIVDPYCFFGANSTVTDGITVARECIIGAGSLISKDTSKRGVYISKPAQLVSKSSNEIGRLLSWSHDVKRR
jgi:sugar O-acyltransferase (sialic acid O-acetyltransferase NeuD family)